jgi:hypothetical protein
MPLNRNPASGSVDDGSGIVLSAAALFAIAWDVLAEMLGTAAVTTIVRRAAGRAAAERPELVDLVDLVVVRGDLEYHYSLPQAWSHKAERTPVALRVLVIEVGRLLVELTGTVVVRRLEQIPELRAAGLVWRMEGSN